MSRPPVTLKLSEAQDRSYREAADRTGMALATWIKDRADVGAIWPVVIKPFSDTLLDLREEYEQITAPRDLSFDGWNEFVRLNVHRLAAALSEAP
jgi:hypothetical protein